MESNMLTDEKQDQQQEVAPASEIRKLIRKGTPAEVRSYLHAALATLGEDPQQKRKLVKAVIPSKPIKDGNVYAMGDALLKNLAGCARAYLAMHEGTGVRLQGSDGSPEGALTALGDYKGSLI